MTEKEKTRLKYDRAQAQVRLGMLIVNDKVKTLLTISMMDVAPHLIDDLALILKDLTERQTRTGLYAPK